MPKVLLGMLLVLLATHINNHIENVWNFKWEVTGKNVGVVLVYLLMLVFWVIYILLN